MILRKRKSGININNFQFKIFSICILLFSICDNSYQKKLLLNDKQNNNNNNNNDDDIETTAFIDSKSNTYETASYNFCPSSCSCLGDYFECKKVNLINVPKLPAWVRSL